jgi:phage terminase Nu1 subunit (DNA packaging protein)
LTELRRRREYASEPWLPKEAVAEHFSVSTSTVYRWVRAGCPIKRLRGGTLRFQLGPLAEWLDEQGRR